jgi:hypothetical protein
MLNVIQWPPCFCHFTAFGLHTKNKNMSVLQKARFKLQLKLLKIQRHNRLKNTIFSLIKKNQINIIIHRYKLCRLSKCQLNVKYQIRTFCRFWRPLRHDKTSHTITFRVGLQRRPGLYLILVDTPNQAIHSLARKQILSTTFLITSQWFILFSFYILSRHISSVRVYSPRTK